MDEAKLTQIKVFVDSEQHRLLRLAAASTGVPLAEFIRQAAIAAANAEMADFTPPSVGQASAKGRKKPAG